MTDTLTDAIMRALRLKRQRDKARREAVKLFTELEAAHKDLALWCKKKEIEAQARARQLEHRADEYPAGYWSGKAEAFSNVWERIVFANRASTLEAYSEADTTWSEAVEVVEP